MSVVLRRQRLLGLMEMCESTEARLTQEMRQGNVEALAVLFSRHRLRLERIIQVRLDPRMARRVSPLDVLQETYLRAAKRLHHFAEQKTLSAFLWFRLLVHQQISELYRKHFRAEKRDIRREVDNVGYSANSDSFHGVASDLLANNSTPSETFSRKEAANRLERVLNELRPIHREIIVLRHFEELTNAEAAVALDIDVGTARKRYVRAIRKMRQQIDSHGWSG